MAVKVAEKNKKSFLILKREVEKMEGMGYALFILFLLWLALMGIADPIKEPEEGKDYRVHSRDKDGNPLYLNLANGKISSQKPIIDDRDFLKRLDDGMERIAFKDYF